MASSSPHDGYSSPLSGRYASKQMQEIWSARRKFETWRKIWLAVAEAQHEMGLPVTAEQVAELRANLDVTDADMAKADAYEAELRHDVMAHVHAWGDRCPKAKGIIHLGMTSQDVNDNCELRQLYQARSLTLQRVRALLGCMGSKADQLKSIATLAFTHYQPAQPTTVGRRLAEAAASLNLVYERFDNYQSGWETLRGFRGATGTQASYLALFENNAARVREFEARALQQFMDRIPTEADFEDWKETLCRFHEQQEAGFLGTGETCQAQTSRQRIEGIRETTFEQFKTEQRQMLVTFNTFDLTGQTYPRVHDAQILADLAAIASVLHKIATDIRLLSNRKELDEPFGDKQIGSSAMPYKRNPMMCERICGLARFVWNLVGNAYDTAATQWLERTLDDSANRRLVLPEAFLALDGALVLMERVIRGLDVHEAMIRKNLMAELPFMATENILMEAVKAGADRQVYHEKIRVHAQAAGNRVKNEGAENDLIERLKGDPAFHKPALQRELDWDGVMDPMKYVGLAVEQTERFLKDVIEPLRERYTDEGADAADAPRV